MHKNVSDGDQISMFFRFSLNRASAIALGVAMVIVVCSVAYTNHLARRMAVEERNSIEIWAEATRLIVQAEDNANIGFLLTIIEKNTTIPVYMLDADGKVLETRNVRRPVKDPTLLNGPIEVSLTGGLRQYIYYDESVALQQLRFLPYVEFSIIPLFMLIAILTLYLAQRNEQSRVWAGLSKETAHQLGTPVSSLMAWQELLRSRYPHDDLIPRMQLDIERLQIITDRFSKIGSVPELHPMPVMPVVKSTLQYMRQRISKRVVIEELWNENMNLVECNLCAPLFQWVIENLIKNAADAMNGAGEIHIDACSENGNLCIDITDTGCGIEKGSFNRIFKPGFTTKSRGWGLGLSLTKRIVEQFHNGKIFVKQSQLNQGTTFRIQLTETEQKQ